MPSPNPALPDIVQDKLKKLPGKPGCYIFKDEKGDVLYVGKALVLKNRVRSYFQSSTRHGIRIARMVSKVRDLEYIVVDSELEALVLECNLIKQYRPPFNVRLRDDKSYPYITITNEAFPRVLFTRKVRKDGGRYFGPYTSAFNVRDTLQLLHKVFPLIPCGKSWTGDPVQRPCLYYHLGRCMGPCAGLSDAKVYKEDVIGKVEKFLSGRDDELLDDLKKQMAKAAEELDFETAAHLRDQVLAIEHTLQKQKVLTSDQVDQDVIAVVKDERGAAIQMLYIRGGKLIGQRQYMLDGASESAPGEAVQEFVKQYYADAPDVPREVLLPVEIEERNIVQTWLRQRRGSAVSVEVPQGGEKLRLVEMAATNAEAALQTFSLEVAAQEQWAEDAMVQLQESLDLDSPPIRIEGYDISNIQGTSPVGSMVVVENGEAAKDEYRRFKVRYHPESPNDFAMMHEVLTRRLRAYIEGDEKFSKLPDLIMIDGGRGQLAAALKARDELGLTVPMVGLAKRLELIIVPTRSMTVPVMSPTDRPGPGPREQDRDGLVTHERDAHATGGTIVPVVSPTDRPGPGQGEQDRDAHATFRPLNPESDLEIRKGAYLPHWTVEGGTYHVVFRLGDSVPREVAEEWEEERRRLDRLKATKTLSPLQEIEYKKLLSDRIDQYLDAGHGACYMRDPHIASLVAETVKHFDGDRYHVHAWSVMPNHVHVIVEPLASNKLEKILHSWKSFSAHKINELLERSGELWQHESYDHLIRTEAEYLKTVAYVEGNPVVANLGNWPWTSGMTVPVMSPTDRPGPGPREQDRDGLATHERDAHATGGTIVPVVSPTDRPGPGPGEQDRDGLATHERAAHATGGTIVPVVSPTDRPGPGPGEQDRDGLVTHERDAHAPRKGIPDPMTLRIKDPNYSYDRVAPIDYAFHDVELPLNSPGLMLLRRLRDEAHRFALTYHRKLRDKRTSGSALEEIPGVGPRRKRLLLRTFGSLAGIRRASVDEIAAVPTMTKRLAEQVKDYLQES